MDFFQPMLNNISPYLALAVTGFLAAADIEGRARDAAIIEARGNITRRKQLLAHSRPMVFVLLALVVPCVIVATIWLLDVGFTNWVIAGSATFLGAAFSAMVFSAMWAAGVHRKPNLKRPRSEKVAICVGRRFGVSDAMAVMALRLTMGVLGVCSFLYSVASLTMRY